MKKPIYLLACLMMFIVTIPIFAQEQEQLADLNQDPDAAPIDNYVFVLVILAITYAVFKIRAINKEKHLIK